ncbi:MAG: nucleoside triphosphate pyrophosphohydrolase [Chitinophagaceae bacterium]|nr:nucleoside triphosphate pyrophosphohydrolase [Chitinophagaceae bacterium]HMN32206.1 nucleoside triphosphate pyrophosphohydrolase [Chitinophagaceae bacterium]
MTEYARSFERLIVILNELREKCPWDQKQTIHSLRQLTIEELYELTDSITDTNWEGIKEELGDLLLHILFYAKIAEEQNQFNIESVIENICNKLVYRHPHIYSNVQVENENDVKKNWEKLKLNEGKKSILSGVPKGLPAMVKALRVQEKAKQVGFEWENINQVKAKLEEEINELEEAIQMQQMNHIEEEFGDVFFSMINYARFLNIDAENALERTNKKFITRFQKIEQTLQEQGKKIQNSSLEEMDKIWNEIKKHEI